MLIIASPVINAVTFKKYSGERAYYMPSLSKYIGESAYDIHSYKIEFPTNGPESLKKIILKNLFDNTSYNLKTDTEKFLSTIVETFSSDEKPQLLSYVPEITHFSNYATIEGSVVSQSSNLIVYHCAFDTHVSGALMSGERYDYINYYIPNKKALKMSDILLSSKKSKITKAIKNNAKKIGLSEPIQLEIPEVFYISSKGITFVYNPYTTIYGYSSFKITVPKSQLTGCLTALGQKLIK